MTFIKSAEYAVIEHGLSKPKFVTMDETNAWTEAWALDAESGRKHYVYKRIVRTSQWEKLNGQ